MVDMEMLDRSNLPVHPSLEKHIIDPKKVLWTIITGPGKRTYGFHIEGFINLQNVNYNL
jgi:hypothetical protein